MSLTGSDTAGWRLHPSGVPPPRCARHSGGSLQQCVVFIRQSTVADGPFRSQSRYVDTHPTQACPSGYPQASNAMPGGPVETGASSRPFQSSPRFRLFSNRKSPDCGQPAGTPHKVGVQFKYAPNYQTEGDFRYIIRYISGIHAGIVRFRPLVSCSGPSEMAVQTPNPATTTSTSLRTEDNTVEESHGRGLRNGWHARSALPEAVAAAASRRQPAARFCQIVAPASVLPRRKPNTHLGDTTCP